MTSIFIVSRYSLFSKGIETLLHQAEGLEIVGCEKDLTQAIEQIRSLQPDVVIVDSRDSDANRGIIMMQVMKEGLRTRVVGLSLNDNKIYVCQGEQKTIEELGDFWESITPGNYSRSEPTSTPSNRRQSRGMRDRYGRTLDYLRISLTDRCNLRCVYCMPSEGVPSKPREAILHSEEIARIVEAAADLGFHAIRLTGGEPLVRKGVVGLVKRLAAIPGIDEVTLTTNATLLSSYAEDLANAGLKRVNISLDSLQPERYRRITRQGNLESVWLGIQAAEAAGLTPLKINMVVIRGFNDDEVINFARLTLEHPWHVRFIEVMPITGVSDWGLGLPKTGERLITGTEIRRRLEELGPLSPVSEKYGNGPARYFHLPGAQGMVGFISPISEHFCDCCNRLRLTADGYLRPCLFSDQGINIKLALTAGASLAELQSLIRQTGDIKPNCHPLLTDSAIAGSAMSMIGG